MAGFLTEEMLSGQEGALQIDRPSIEWMMTNDVIKRSQGSLVVLDPTIPWNPQCKGPDDPFFKEEVVLFTYFFGDHEDWEHDFDKHALAKAYASWKTGLPSIRIQQELPYLFEKGMSKYGGSAVGPGNLIVAFSGVEQWFDEMTAEMMVPAIKGVCRDEVEKTGLLYRDAAIDFIGD